MSREQTCCDQCGVNLPAGVGVYKKYGWKSWCSKTCAIQAGVMQNTNPPTKRKYRIGVKPQTKGAHGLK